MAVGLRGGLFDTPNVIFTAGDSVTLYEDTNDTAVQMTTTDKQPSRFRYTFKWDGTYRIKARGRSTNYTAYLYCIIYDTDGVTEIARSSTMTSSLTFDYTAKKGQIVQIGGYTNNASYGAYFTSLSIYADMN